MIENAVKFSLSIINHPTDLYGMFQIKVWIIPFWKHRVGRITLKLNLLTPTSTFELPNNKTWPRIFRGCIVYEINIT